LGNAFERNYDRSGIFHELQFSGTINNAAPIETLYWTMGIGGGLGGKIIPEKKIWLGDYVHFSRVGRYRINLRYQDSILTPDSSLKGVDYNLGNFSIIYFPENPVSKFLKQVALTVGMFVPSDNFRTLAVKWLGYQETALSTYALAKYNSVYWDDLATNQPHGHSVFETYRGTLRNYQFCTVGRILRPFEQHPYSLLGTYFHFHCFRLIYPLSIESNQVPPEVTESAIAQLIECTYQGIDRTSKENFVKTTTNLRDQQADAYWHTVIDKLEYQEAQGTNQTEMAHIRSRIKSAEARLAEDKNLRDLRLRLIDYTLAHIPEQDRKVGAGGSNAVARTASQ